MIWNTDNKVSKLPGWIPYTTLPHLVTFDKLIATTSNENDQLWGLSPSDFTGGGGLYLLTDPSTGTWSMTSAANTQDIKVLDVGTATFLERTVLQGVQEHIAEHLSDCQKQA